MGLEKVADWARMELAEEEVLYFCKVCSAPNATAPPRGEDDFEFVQLDQSCKMLTCKIGAEQN